LELGELRRDAKGMSPDAKGSFLSWVKEER
jgi:hypothetical protein